MATEPVASGLTYDDLQAFPDDNLRREIIGGELFVTAAPALRHQRVVATLVGRLFAWSKEHGGEVFPAPTDVYFSHVDVVEPDVVFVRAENLGKLEKKFIRSAPDLAVEVSSPTTRRLELVRKKELYEREGVPEYWHVDLDAERLEVYRLEERRYAHPDILERGDSVESTATPGLVLSVDEILGPVEEEAATE